MKVYFSSKKWCHDWCQNCLTNAMYDAHKHMGLSMCWKTTDGEKKNVWKYVFIMDLRLNLLSNQSGNINFVDGRECIQFLIVFFGIKRLPRNKFIREEYFVWFTGCSVYESKFSVVMATRSSFVIASVDWGSGKTRVRTRWRRGA